MFARDAATRRGKARKELKERTGLGDEQIEGWKVMLERDVSLSLFFFSFLIFPFPPSLLSSDFLSFLSGFKPSQNFRHHKSASHPNPDLLKVLMLTVILDRNFCTRQPKKLQKMQDKHVDLGARSNRPSAPTDDASASSSRAPRATQDGTAKPKAPGPNSGGGKGGGTKAGGSGQGPGQGQKTGTGSSGPKRSDGGRREHDRAKRGRDRKLARMGAAGAPP